MILNPKIEKSPQATVGGGTPPSPRLGRFAPSPSLYNYFQWVFFTLIFMPGIKLKFWLNHAIAYMYSVNAETQWMVEHIFWWCTHIVCMTFFLIDKFHSWAFEIVENWELLCFVKKIALIPIWAVHLQCSCVYFRMICAIIYQHKWGRLLIW